MQYDLNQLSDPKRFQRLVNAILTARFGEDARVTPLQGRDGGSDGETAADNPYMEFILNSPHTNSNNPLVEPPRTGRYLFQAKYHRTGENRLSDLRSLVVREFKDALTNDVLNRSDRQDVNYFFVVTNVTTSYNSFQKIDDIRKKLLKGQHHLHADIWGGDTITTFLDWSPALWHAYPELFPGGVPPLMGMAATQPAEGLSRTFQLAVTQQYERDSQVKFRQIELAKRLLDLFVDLDVALVLDDDMLPRAKPARFIPRTAMDFMAYNSELYRVHRTPKSALHLLLDDNLAIPRILLEGGPGQGKSTITQMVAQIYREKFLETRESESRDSTWHRLCQLRIPIRLELRDFAHWIAQNSNGTLEQYIVRNLGRDSGGATVSVEDFHRILQDSSVILLLDGLDEIGNDDLRDQVLDVAMEAITRFEKALRTDVRVCLTTRPPAVLGRWNKLEGFVRVLLVPMGTERIDDYVDRWLHTQISNDEEEMDRIRASFNRRRHDSHVEALARNPMQLSVLLQFISLKGEAFPDRRAELYREYFQIVIDRDVEKSSELREHRELIEGLHSYLGFKLHGTAEIEQGGRGLNRDVIVDLAGHWLEREGHSKNLAADYFALGEERFGLIVALYGEGHETAYGFEVQPIQEYFAAAYISNRLTNGKAHDVFESLIYRDYWREVALFLAGLRRPNEKADLIARAKAADSDSSILGQQNGRAIILQLLREGVLTQPRHVQKEAMWFAIGFLDAPVLRLQRSLITIIDSLSALSREYGDIEIHAKIMNIIEQLAQSDDYGLVSLVHRLAGKALSKENYIKLVLGYSGKAPETRGLVRITHPFYVPDVIEELGSSVTYWEYIPSRILARRLWTSVTHSATVPEIVYPLGVHSGLILEFAFSQSDTRRRGAVVIKIKGASVPAIWKLQQNIQLIRFWPLDNQENPISDGEHLAVGTTAKLSWTDGRSEPLSPDVEQCLRDLIDVTDNVISAFRDRRKLKIRKSVVAYLTTTRKLLAEPGIVGWIASRCAVEMFKSPQVHTHSFGTDGLADDIMIVLNELYFRTENFLPLEVYFDVQFGIEEFGVERFGFGMPYALRLARGAALRPLYQVVADLVLERLDPDEKRYCSWLEGGIPIPSVLIRPLVDACRYEMEKLLRFVGSHAVPSNIRHNTTHRLLVRDTRRILKICRETQDPEILKGAATILMHATFSRLAQPELVQKILSAAPDSPLVMRVFGARGSIRERKLDPHSKQLALDVAHRIVGQPEVHAFRVVNRAVAFLAEAEAEATRSKPLFEDCPELLQFP